jgi:hypothetical protein
MSMPAIERNSSPAKCAGDAMPAEEKVSRPGCARASATSSAVLDAFTKALTNSAFSDRATLAIG